MSNNQDNRKYYIHSRRDDLTEKWYCFADIWDKKEAEYLMNKWNGAQDGYEYRISLFEDPIDEDLEQAHQVLCKSEGGVYMLIKALHALDDAWNMKINKS